MCALFSFFAPTALLPCLNFLSKLAGDDGICSPMDGQSCRKSDSQHHYKSRHTPLFSLCTLGECLARPPPLRGEGRKLRKEGKGGAPHHRRRRKLQNHLLGFRRGRLGGRHGLHRSGRHGEGFLRRDRGGSERKQTDRTSGIKWRPQPECARTQGARSASGRRWSLGRSGGACAHSFGHVEHHRGRG